MGYVELLGVRFVLEKFCEYYGYRDCEHAERDEYELGMKRGALLLQCVSRHCHLIPEDEADSHRNQQHAHILDPIHQ